jgi:hypothetical protein
VRPAPPGGDARGAGDAALERLVGLARGALTGQPWRADEDDLRRLQERRLGRVRARRVRLTAAVAAGAMAVALPIALLLWRRPAPLTFEVIHGQLGEAGEVRTADAGTSIHFSYGSEVVLEREARAQIRDLVANGGRIVLASGRARAYFVPRPKARWQVVAGPYTVYVTGTLFDVDWSDGTQGLDVWLRKGTVTVRGPMIEAGIFMTHGQHLLLRLRESKIVLDDQQPAEAPAAAAPAAEPAAAVAGAPAPAPAAAVAAAPSSAGAVAAAPVVAPAAAATRDTESWRRRLAKGDFDAVVAAAERRGIDAVVARGTRAELAALADAARYTRRAPLADRALRAERERFPRSPEGRDAAYFLGTLADDGGAAAAALDWYGRYLREQPAGTFAGQALGRAMSLEARGPAASGAAAARDADEYLRRFPGGPYAGAATRILRAR